MMMSDPNEKMLDDMFAQARQVEPAPSDALMARIVADAATVQTVPQPVAQPKPSIWTQISDAIGGWPALSGLAAATVAGVWIGVAPPSSVEEFTASLLGDEVSVDVFTADFGLAAGDFADG